MDLSTNYMGLRLANPLVASSSPLTADVDSVRRLEDAGIGAVVLHSLFEEQIRYDAHRLDYFLQNGSFRFAESLTYYPDVETYHVAGIQEYLDLVARCRQAVAVPVIASLNGISADGLAQHARQIEQAGAHGLELNVYYIPTDPSLTAERVENLYASILQAVRKEVTIPVAMKLAPCFTALVNVARRLTQLRADALVLFNRFYQPEIDVDDLSVRPSLTLSTPAENRLSQRWIALLHGRVNISLAASTGIHSGADAARAILAGADAAMTASALLINGVEHVASMKAGLVRVMQEHEYESVAQMKGALSQKNCPEPAAFERANYMKILHGYVQTGTLE